VIALPTGTRVWLAAGRTDMREGFNGLALQVQEVLRRDPHGGHLFVFRGRRGDLVKVLWHDGQGLCLFAKRLERGRFVSYGLCQRRWACVTDRPSLGRRIVDAHDPHG
jgi:transposase